MFKKVILLSLLFFCIPLSVFAQESSEQRGVVISVEDIQSETGDYVIAEVKELESGVIYTIDTSQGYLHDNNRFNVRSGDKVLIQVIDFEDGTNYVYLVDVYRTKSILWIFAFFALITIIIGKKRGFSALFGIAVTIVILFGFLFPVLLKGWDAVLWTVIASIVILTVNMFLSHGWDRSSQAALFGTYGGLLMVVIFAFLFTSISRLSGLGAEDAALLVLESGVIIPKGILLASVILGAVGILDDVAINQTEIVSEISKADKRLPRTELFKRAMHIGKHHIASSVNTLVLAYVGAALPLFLLFMLTDINWMRFISEEVVAEEIIRTLAGTTALILTVPLSTWFAVLLQKR